MKMYRMMTGYKGGKEEGTNGDPKPLACVHRRTSVVEGKEAPEGAGPVHVPTEM